MLFGLAVLVLVVLLLCAAVFIASIVIGAQHMAPDVRRVCMATGIELDVSQWLLYGGIVSVVKISLTVLVVGACICKRGFCDSGVSTDSELCEQGSCDSCFCNCVSAILTVFWIAWFVTGVVLLSFVPAACREQYGNTVYAMAVAALVYQVLLIMFVLANRYRECHRDEEK